MSRWDSTALPGLYQRYAGDDGDKFYAEKVQDVQPILDRNKALKNHDDGWNKARDGRRIASIPLVLVIKWRNEGFDIHDPNNMPELKRRLNSSEYMHLRTSEGVF